MARLINEAGRGDQTALAAFYDHTSSLVYDCALNILGNSSTAEVVTIHVYTHVYRQASNYDPSKEAPLTWLLALTRNQAAEHLHCLEAQQRERGTPMRPHTVDASPPANSKESNAATALRNVIEAALTSLGTEQRQAVELVCRARLTPGDIAAGLGLPVETIKMRLQSGMVALRNQLRPLLDKGTHDPSIPDR